MESQQEKINREMFYKKASCDSFSPECRGYRDINAWQTSAVLQRVTIYMLLMNRLMICKCKMVEYFT